MDLAEACKYDMFERVKELVEVEGIDVNTVGLAWAPSTVRSSPTGPRATSAVASCIFHPNAA